MTQEVPKGLIGSYRITLESTFKQLSQNVNECIRIYFNFDEVDK